jgi:alpha-aminoadipic semialdehyde synthase
MRRAYTVGILREARHNEARSPLTPSDVLWLRKRGISVEVESSGKRVFSDAEYRRHGASVLNQVKRASVLVGVKEPDPSMLRKDRVYMVFSHTAKGQPQNMPLLRECIKKKVTLIDYEKITDPYGRRLVFFGRFAGICGAVGSMYYLGKRLSWEGIKNPFASLGPVSSYASLAGLKSDIASIGHRIAKEGVDRKISPFIIGITGRGNVSAGINEILAPLNPIEIHPKDMDRFVRHQRYIRNRVYKIIFYREEKLRPKKKGGFYFEDYLKSPERFVSNMDRYLPYMNMLLHASYWDSRYPRLVTKRMVNRLYKDMFRLKFIGDISCDVNGSIELTYKTTTPDRPTFTYDPATKGFVDGYESDGITVMARDNLPTELPRDASKDFSGLIREYLYQIAAHGVNDVTKHVAIPREVRGAAIVDTGKITKPYSYLKRFIWRK